MSSGTGTAIVIIKTQNFEGTVLVGQGRDCYLFGDDSHDGFPIEYPTRAIQVTAGDNVVGSTKTLVFAKGNFTSADIGAALTLAGTAGGTNDGTIVVSSVTDAHTIVCSAATLVDETFDPNSVTASIVDATLPAHSAIADLRRANRFSLQLITENDSGQTLTGDWLVEVSDDYVQSGVTYGQSANEGRWSVIDFGSALAPVTDASNQFVQADICARAVRVTFTPTA